MNGLTSKGNKGREVEISQNGVRMKKVLSPGDKWGSYSIVERLAGNPGKCAVYLARCECGNVKRLYSTNFSKNTGLACRECSGAKRVKHGMSGTPLYQNWAVMIQRCENPNQTEYRYYGGRGIRVCAWWHKFENFYYDMGDKPSPDHSIDRIDNNGHYEPTNCCWATRSEQQLNRR